MPRTLQEIVEQADYASENADAAVVLPSVLVAWVKALANDVRTLAAMVEEGAR